ncbi:MAG TPA: hypothetical protein VKG24_11290 [Pseudolabrys sp.]|nr:hypothetical protein [Pseudolabrys sp.]
MLLTLSDEIRDCYRLAEDAKRKADGAIDPVTKKDYLDLERRWLFLAHGYEFTERLAHFTAERPRGGKRG